MKKRVTMRDIGQALGVSTVTISKALGGREGVSDAVREKILKTAQEMGYSYPTPGNPREETPGEIVGILMPARFFGTGSFYAALYMELTAKLLEAGMLGTLEIISPEKEESAQPPVLLETGKVTALVVMGNVAASYLDMLNGAGLPAVLLDFYSENTDFDAVVSDGQGGSFLLTQMLLSRGHREIGFVGSIDRTSSIMDRYSGYLRAMVLSGVQTQDEWRIPDCKPDGSYLDELPLPEKMPTAFVCNNDNVAMQLKTELEKRGLRVPEDISVTGFDDFPPRGDGFLTTYHVDQERMALATVRQLRRRMQDGAEGAVRIVVGGWMVQGRSVADRS